LCVDDVPITHCIASLWTICTHALHFSLFISL